MTAWFIPVATMARVDDTTARMLAGTIAESPRGERDDDAPVGPVITPDEWRARHTAVAA